jgi:branched-chain amino acid transport system ATP-binding protein
MLNVQNISASYGKRQVLYNISLKVEKGEIILLCGANGSGKSTFLKAIYCLIPKIESGTKESSGHSVWFNNEDITMAQPFDLLGKGLLSIPQKDSLFNDLTVHENLQIAAGSIPGSNNLKERIKDVYEMFPELKSSLKRYPMKMSGGEKQLLAFAMIYLHRPRMILLDEPFAGLNKDNIKIVSDKIGKLNKNGITFLIIEHKIDEALNIASRVVGLKEGKIIYDRLKADAKKEEIFNILN